MPTIRIDNEVYAWLQSQARAFEDSPNSVLRRVSGIDSKPFGGGDPTRSQTSVGSGQQNAAEALTGAKLNLQWNVGAKHALFSSDGTWFENLTKFPGALFDPNGFLLFKSEKEYRNTQNVSVTKKTNVRGGIDSIPGYTRVK